MSQQICALPEGGVSLRAKPHPVSHRKHRMLLLWFDYRTDVEQVQVCSVWVWISPESSHKSQTRSSTQAQGQTKLSFAQTISLFLDEPKLGLGGQCFIAISQNTIFHNLFLKHWRLKSLTEFLLLLIHRISSAMKLCLRPWSSKIWTLFRFFFINTRWRNWTWTHQTVRD